METLRDLIRQQYGFHRMLQCEDCGEFFEETPDRTHEENHDGEYCGGEGHP